MKIIKTTTLLLLISFVFSSCGLDMFNRVEGNRNVISKNRKINGDFTKISVSNGLNVHISQGNEFSISVEADENLHDIIKTDVENGRLKIYTKKSIWRYKKAKIHVVVKDIEEIKSASGSNVYSDEILKVNDIKISTSSGADMKIQLEAITVRASSSSGSDLKISGETESFFGNSSSGSNLNAYNLKSKNADVNTSSGADLKVYVTESLSAKASSGGDIKYKGNPKNVSKVSTSGGDVTSRSN